MKKSVIISGVLVLAGAIALVVYLNMGPSASQTAQQQDGAPDSSENKNAMRPINAPQGSGTPGQPLTPDEQAQKKRALDEFVTRAQVDKDFAEAAKVLEDLLKEIPPEAQKMMKEFIDKLNGPALIEEYKAELANKFNTAELERLAQIHSDRDLVLFHEATKRANTPEGMKDLQKHLRDFDIEKLPPDRREALTQIADAQLEALSGLDSLGKLSDGQKGELDAFKEEMRKMTVAQMDSVLKGKNTELIRHLGAQTSDELYKREMKIRAEAVMRHFLMGAEAAENAMPN